MAQTEIVARLHEQVRVLEERSWALEALAFPIINLAGNGAVLWANAAAEVFLSRGRALLLRDGRLRAEIPSEDAELQNVIRKSVNRMRNGLSVQHVWLRMTRGDDGTDVSILLASTPTKMGRLGMQAGFLVFVSTPCTDGETITCRLRKIWGLTEAEAELALQLSSADGLPAAAKKLGISRNTAKTQLASIFLKSGARRQGELMRKILGLAVISDPAAAVRTREMIASTLG
jgi:DNA-binding CsgD family transcriptional regulator